MAAGLLRKQYEGLKTLAEAYGITVTTPEGSFNEKFIALCRIIVEDQGETFTPLRGGTFTSRKANGLWQVALALGGSKSALGMRPSMLASAKSIWDIAGDGEAPDLGGSLDWRTYQYLMHSAYNAIQWPYSGGTDNLVLDRRSNLDQMKVINANYLQFDGIGDSVLVAGEDHLDTSQPFTASIEFKCTAGTTGYILYQGIGGTQTQRDLSILMDAGQLQTYAGTDSYLNVGADEQFTDGTWYRCEIDSDGVNYTATVYDVDTNTQQATATRAIGGNLAVTKYITIGARVNGSSSSFSVHFGGDVGKWTISGVLECASTEGGGSTVHDVNGNGNHGTITTTSGLNNMWQKDATGTLSSWSYYEGFSSAVLSSTAQFVDTLIADDANLAIEIEGSLREINDIVFMGARTTSAGDFYIGSSGSAWRFGYGSASATDIGVADTDHHTWKISSDGLCYLDGELVADKSGSTRTAIGYQLYIFARNLSGVTNKSSAFLMRRARIWNGETLVFDGYPQQDGYVFDAVSGETRGSGDLSWVEIPALFDGSTDAIGNQITNPGGYLHNGCGVSLLQQDADFSAFGGASLWGDGVSWSAVTWADLIAHQNFSLGLVLQWEKSSEGRCLLKEGIQSNVDYYETVTPGIYNRAYGWSVKYTDECGADPLSALYDSEGSLLTDASGYVLFA